MIKFIFNAISRGLGFSKAETKGVFLLVILILLSFIVPQIIIYQLKTDRSALPEDDPEALKNWIAEVRSSYDEKMKKEREPQPANFDKSVYFPKKRTVNRKEVRKEDQPAPAETALVVKKEIIDLNKATAEQLQEVRGIGPAFSKRIIKYRDLLGGFADAQQLNEVYGLEREVIEKINEQFAVQSGVQPFDFNTDSVKVLAKHPYISYDLAWVIFNFREANGDIKGPDDLREIKAINDSLFNKLKPYLNQ